MREVYVYDEFCNDFDNLGLVGALTPTSCEHEEIAGGMSEVVLVHPIDETGKYKALEKGRILKCIVPVRTTPEIDGTTVVTTVEKWHVDPLSTKAQRKVWSKREEGKKLGSLKANDKVIVVKRNNTWDRYKIKAKKLNGWFDKTALVFEASETLPPNDPTAIEDIYPLWGDKEQLFRIYAEDRSDTEITIHARHISYDLLSNMTMYKNNEEVSLATAVNGVFTQCVDAHEFTVQTNVADERTGVDYRHNNPINALFDPEEGILKRWDVQLVRDDYELTILKTVGKNRGMSIEYGRNLTGVTCTIDTSNVVTCVLPTGVDHDGKPLYLTDDVLVNGHPNPANYVFAKQSIRDMYPFEHVYHLECEDCTEGSEEADDKKKKYTTSKSKVRERMLDQAYEVLWEDKAHHGDDDQPSANTMPTVSLQVQFVTLGDTEEYKQFKDLERLFLYDKVRVRVPKLNIDMLLDAVRVKTDCLTGHTVEVEIGAVTDIEVSVPSWAIQSLNGGKIVAGSIPAGSFGPGVITADAIFANAITADKIAANSITADKMSANTGEFVDLVAQNLTTETFSAHYADIETLVAGTVQATDISADHIKTGTLDAMNITVTNLDASGIVAGTIQGNMIDAGQISVDKLTGNYASFNALVVGNINANDITAGMINASTIASSALETAFAGIADAQISHAAVDQLDATGLRAAMATIGDARITHATTDQLDTTGLRAAMATIGDARITYATTDQLDATGLQAAMATIGDARITHAITDQQDTIQLKATMATIADGKIALLNAKNIKVDDTISADYIIGSDGYFTGKINAGSIDAGEISADLLRIRGEDGLFYRINVAANNAHEITAEEWGEGEAENHLYGASIMDGTLDAAKIRAESIEAQQIAAGTIDVTRVTEEFGAGLIISSNQSITALAGSIDADHSMIVENADSIASLVSLTSGHASSIEQNADNITLALSRISDTEGAIAEERKWMTFDENYLTIAKSNSPFSVNITNEALNFNRGSNTVAYMNTERFGITDGEITHSLKIGKFSFVPQSNGNMSLLYTG